jgi:excisionase family DNA binding protein
MATKSKPRRFVSVGTAADYCDVTPKTVRRWITEGRLPAYRVGNRLIKVDLADLDALARRIPIRVGDSGAA